jgi:hypothetical protein
MTTEKKPAEARTAVLWRFEIATRILHPSATCRALHGLAADAPFTWADYLSSIHPDDRPMHRAALDDAINETGRFDAKYRVVWPDRSVHRVHALGTISPELSGAPLQMVGASIELPD